RAEHVAKVGGILAEIGTDGRLSFRAAIAFVEDQVENLVHGVEPLDQLGSVGGLESHVLINEVECSALKSLLDCLFRKEKRPGNFGDPKAAKRLQGHGDLVFAGQEWMT